MSPMPGGGPGRGGQTTSKPKNFKKTMLALAHYLRGHYKQLIAVALFAIASTVFSIIGPKLLGSVTTEVANGAIAKLSNSTAGMNYDFIGKMLVGLAVLYLAASLFNYMQHYIMTSVTMHVTYRFRKDISEKMNRLPLNYYDTRTHGEVLSRITNDVDTLSQTLSQTVNQLITSVATIIGVLVMMCSISLSMTGIALLIVPLSGVLMMVVVKHSQKYFRSQQKRLGDLNGHVEEMYGGHNVVQVFNHEEDSIAEFSRINSKLYTSAWKSQFLSGLMMPIMTFVGNLGYVIVCVMGGVKAVSGTITIGNIQAFIQYMRTFTQPISQIANIFNTLQATAAAAERVFEFLAEEEETPEPENPQLPKNVQGAVEFQHVSFGYEPGKIIIHDFSAQVQQGQKVAIVGPTGAGKSTIIKLLMKFYDINSGEILIDGVKLSQITRKDLRSLFGMVLQDTWLYHASILDNIRYGSFDKSREEVIAAAKAAHCDEFIRTLPQGYDTELNEEATNISQGQKQLLTIARVILADPKILILDEATSSVDTRTELLIQKAMDNLSSGRTSFVIAHRLSTIRDADLILVLNNGDILEQGTHEELLAKKGFYADLYNSQFSRAG